MATTADVELFHCPSCGATNRVPTAALRAGKRPACGKCKTPLSAATGPVTITDANFATEVEASRTPVLLDMWAAWCGPCRMLAPVIDELAGELAGRVKVGKLNVDENPSTAGRFGVRSIPTLLVLKGGREVDRLVGVLPKAEIARRLEHAIA
jgi:thioredoxin 2